MQRNTAGQLQRVVHTFRVGAPAAVVCFNLSVGGVRVCEQDDITVSGVYGFSLPGRWDER